ncbi:MAG TPA: PilT/PilU family type 4a pilus ATPase [Deinococcales bacterium]|nr:PilT/PilU family type 4a pilus ATPase [Deinococcales bacterium]
MTVVELLNVMVARRASDIHLQAGAPPTARIDGRLAAVAKRALSADDTRAIAKSLMTTEQWQDFEYGHELDFAYSVPGLARFRCNAFRQRGSIGLVLRVIGASVPSFAQLGLPEDLLQSFAAQERGLVLCTGPTGSGKSTTLASVVDHINRNYAYNIITIEDPIEVLHSNARSLVVQREVGSDTGDFRAALKYALRQDPDVIMIGEMRDKETVEAAISAAQTGHLVLSTLHTLDAVRTVNRVIDFFEPYERDQIRIMLAESLIGILSQRLLRRADGQGRVLALETLVNTPLIRDYIKDSEKTALIRDAMQEDNIRGMRTFDQHLVELYTRGLITMDEALGAATSPHEFRLLLTRVTGG